MSGSNLPSMAWRNIWRNKRRTGVTLFGIAFGTMLAVLFTGIGDSSWTDMINLAARMGGGHITVQHKDYLDSPSLGKTVRGADELAQKLLARSDVERVAARITGNAMLSTANENTGAIFIAFDPRKEDARTLSVFNSVSKGRMFNEPDEKGIIVGQKLAEKLGADLGRKIVYTLTDKHGEMVSGLARVSGIVSSGSPSLDAHLALLPIDTVRKEVGFSADEVTQIALFLKDHRLAKELSARLKPTFGPTTTAVTWRESQPGLAGFISMKISGTVFFEVLIMILVAAGIFNTLFVSVMERLREFGIMMAIGFSPRKLFGLVMWESLWVAVAGLVAAVVFTALPYYLGNTYGIDFSKMTGGQSSEISGVAISPIMYIAIFPENAVLIAGAVMAATLLSGLYPAWRAGRVVPVDAIKLV